MIVYGAIALHTITADTTVIVGTAASVSCVAQRMVAGCGLCRHRNTESEEH